MKIAVIGVYYSPNLGDAVICDCVISWMKEKWPQASIDIIDIENKTCFYEQKNASMCLLGYRSIKLQWDYWQTRHCIRDRVYYWNKEDVKTRQDFYDRIVKRNYDAAVFAGGQLFMDWLSMDVCEFLKRFEKKKTPVYFNACGVGISVSCKIRKLLSRYLLSSNVKLISSRDDVECVENLYLDNRKKVIKTFDPALWSANVYGGSMLCSSNIVGLGIMYSNHAPIWKITAFWLKLICELDEKKIRWKMFCNGAIDDYNYASYILKKARKKKEEYLCDCPQNPGELVKLITSFRSLISFRLHSHIVAASYGIPAVAIVWDEKLRFFYRNLGHEERCRTIYDKPESVLESLQTAQEEGYDKELIEKQKNFSRTLLLEALSGEKGIE